MTGSRPRCFEDILAKLTSPHQSGDHWTAPCPLPGHKTPAGHLSLKDAGDKALVTCQGGRHSYRDICQALGFASLTYSDNGNGPEDNKQKTLVATFAYEYERDKEAYQIRRYDLGGGNKTFEAWHKKDGKYVPGMGESKDKPILYHQPEIPDWIAASKRIYLPEGERKADVIISKGGAATTSPFGAGPNKWRPEFSETLAGAEVVILPDNDKTGRDFAQDKATSLYSIAKSVKVLELPGLPEKGDIIDWFNAGGTFGELEQLASEAPKWKPSSQGFVLTPLADLLGEPPEAISWLWEDTLPRGGLSLLAAKPKVGKSTMARNLALAVARGEEFLGRTTNPGPVLCLCLEEKRAEVRSHFRRMGGANERIHVQVGGAPEEALTSLRQAIEETGAVLAIVDPLLKLIRLRDANDYAEVTRALAPLLALARETDCHIMVIHHEGKGATFRETGDGILGSTALFGSVDTALIMRRRDNHRTLESIQRYGTDIPRTVMSYDKDLGKVEATGTVEDLEIKRVSEAILEALDDKELTEPEIRELVEGRTKVQAAALRQLFEAGQVGREGLGKKGDPYRYKKARSLVPSIYPERAEQENQETFEPKTVGVAALSRENGGDGRGQENAEEGVV